MRPTFSGFYIAKQGMDVARANLQVTGQNLNLSLIHIYLLFEENQKLLIEETLLFFQEVN